MKARKPVWLVLAFTAGIAVASAAYHLQRLASGDRAVSPAPAAPVASAPGAMTPTGDASVIGQRRPDFRLPDPDGIERGPGDFAGKVLVVNFWATWCPPCREEMPGFMTLQTRYAERGVQFLGVATDEVDNVRRFVAEMGLNYPTVYGQQRVLDASTAYGNRIGALPYTAIVGRDGTLLATHVGALEVGAAEALIKAALGP